ncbi:MAG TPA: NAD(P)/FAD-dependent oxidoreductase [Polyangiales bacterium]
MEERWDVIIVGARCAGATLATLLARRGLRILLLEASSRGTNMPMSTHLVQSAGMDVLDRLGVGGRVRACTPPSARLRFALDDAAVIPQAAEGRAAYCVRRSTLDPWLQDTAEQAGAELRCRERVIDLLRQGERVTGVVVRTPEGVRSYHAELVVGADGVHSSVAELAGVESYLVSDCTRAGHFSYYPAPERWDEEWDGTLEHRGNELRYVFRTDGDQVLLVYVGEREEVNGWGAQRAEKLREAFARSPSTRRLSEGKAPLGASVGLLKATFFYRRPVGPGFALVGDAGHFKDFVTGQGMADAFLDAEQLATAILDGRDEAFTHYWRESDVLSLPLHFDANRQGAVGYNEPFMRWVIGRIARDPALTLRVSDMLDRKIDPGEMVPGGRLVAMVGAALLRGRFDVLGGFLATGRQLGREAKELAARRALLAEAQARLATAPPRARQRVVHEHAA